MPRKTPHEVQRGLALLVASMRPRPDAAENVQERLHPGVRYAASMRPRPDAAENTALPARSVTSAPGFNEAAARCRGKRRQPAFTARRIIVLQ